MERYNDTSSSSTQKPKGGEYTRKIYEKYGAHIPSPLRSIIQTNNDSDTEKQEYPEQEHLGKLAGTAPEKDQNSQTSQDGPSQSERRPIPHFGPPENTIPPQKLERPQPPKEGSQGRLEDLPAYRYREKKELSGFLSESSTKFSSIFSSRKEEIALLSAKSKDLCSSIEKAIGEKHSRDYEDVLDKYRRELSILATEKGRLLQLDKEIRKNVNTNKEEFSSTRKEKIVKDMKTLMHDYEDYYKKRIQVFTEHSENLLGILEKLRPTN